MRQADPVPAPSWRARPLLRLLVWLVAALLPLSGCVAANQGQPVPPQEAYALGESGPADVVPAVMRCLYYESELFLPAISAPRPYEGGGRLAAGMVPHHLTASDMIAGFFSMASADPQGYDTVLLVSPSHFPETCTSDVVTSSLGWETPYGSAPADTETVDRLLQNSAIAAADQPAAVEMDHGVAGLIPFIKYYLPNAKIATCLLSNKLDRNRLDAVAAEIASLCESGRVLLVASVDCSHYLSPDKAALCDAQTAQAIEEMDFSRILSFGDSNVDSPQALTVFLKTAQSLNAVPKQLDHASSAEKLPHALSNPVYREGVTTYLVYAAYSPLPHAMGEPERTAALVAVGDLMVHGDQLRSAFNAETGAYSFSHSFEQVRADISAGDLAIGNLETVLAGGEVGYSDYPRFNTPDSFAQALEDAGFDFLTTANNHCMDKEEAGLLRTLDVLDSIGIGHTGTFSSPAGHGTVAIRDINGIRIALASFTFGTNGIPIPPEKPYLVNHINRETIRAALASAKAQGADWIVALPHMGEEYEPRPREAFIQWADFMIACGADMVLASHPHVLQPMEVKTVTGSGGKTREAFVAYSLGNFVSCQRDPPQDTGMILQLLIKKSPGAPAYLEKASFIPTWVQYRDADGRVCIRVLPVGDAIADYEEENRLRIRPQDYTRLCQAHDEVTALYFGQAAGRRGMQRAYDFYTRTPT